MLSLYFVQIAFNDDDGSNRDQDLVSLWESFQPHVVPVSRKSPCEVLMELELLEGEVSNEVKEGEEWEDKTREDVEERSISFSFSPRTPFTNNFYLLIFVHFVYFYLFRHHRFSHNCTIKE